MTEAKKDNLRDLFEKTYEELSDAIFRYCYFQTSNREKALDLTNDTFLKTWQYLAREKGEEVNNLRAFLYKVARNLVIDSRRKKKSDSLDSLMENGFELTSDESEIIVKENEFEAKMAIEAIKDLDEKYREILMMRFVEDMSVKDIADILGHNENTVSVRIHRAMDKLKKILEKKPEYRIIKKKQNNLER